MAESLRRAFEDSTMERVDVAQDALQMFNKPDVTENLHLPADGSANDKDGVPRRLHYDKDHRLDNAGTYRVWLEDHTLCNAVKMQLLENPEVLFAGYRHPHPLTNMFELRVQTRPGCTPHEAVARATHELIQISDRLELKFRQQMEEQEGGRME